MNTVLFYFITHTKEKKKERKKGKENSLRITKASLKKTPSSFHQGAVKKSTRHQTIIFLVKLLLYNLKTKQKPKSVPLQLGRRKEDVCTV